MLKTGRIIRGSLSALGLALVLAIANLGGVGETNAYTQCSCTAYASSRRPDLPLNLGNAKDWARNAQLQGFPVDGSPRVGDIAVFPPNWRDSQGHYASDLGHVAYVESVNGTSYVVSDWNGGCVTAWGSRDTRDSHEGVRFIHRKGPQADYNRFVARTGTIFGLDHYTNWEFASGDINRDGYVDLIGILERGPTGSGRIEIHVGDGRSNFTTALLRTATPLDLSDPDDWEFEAGDINGDGYLDIVGILESASTGSGLKEIHALNGRTNFTSFVLQRVIPLAISSPHQWEFMLGDYDRDSVLDLIGVIEQGPTGTGTIEVHALSGSSQFQIFNLHTGSALPLGDHMAWEFEAVDTNQDGFIDLLGVLEKGPTGTGRREAHALNGRTNFTSFVLHAATGFGLDSLTNWEFTVGDLNRDGTTDLIGILETGPTGTGRREVHAAG